ncbi:putative lipoprotein YerB [Sporosarcina sp. NCCP-2716]|uniref:DUF3048 domain-containing protein n=1 Tax=Sporosarcina sp. NCCP-2716 TaxID=2943679 RepID=UPI00203CCDBB|nr:DUF3048 domain-containing protein [Sporosarcina sp. NCCP-2716]GKV69805.1 putative lipoprotein YerB [Sporosarcina sp. NCCP-2716]
MNGTKLAGAAFLCTALLLTGCTKNDEVMNNGAAAETADGETGIEQALLETAPFTGVPGESYPMRPILATVNNHPLARPQSGLSKADIIYEVLAEGNITRLLALYQSGLPDEIGPIRSARDYFIDIAAGLDAFYIAHGYSPDAREMLADHAVDSVNGMQYDGTYFERSRDRKAPHNSYISKAHIEDAMTDLHIEETIRKVPHLSFHPDAESAKLGELATTVVVGSADPNFTSTYAFDADKRVYTREVNGILTVDKADETHVTPANVLVVEAPYETIDSEGRQSLDLSKGGRAVLFQNGIALDTEWKMIDGIITPVENGVPAKFVPGQTWVHIVPEQSIGQSVTYTP